MANASDARNAVELRRCHICNQLDVFTVEMRRSELQVCACTRYTRAPRPRGARRGRSLTAPRAACQHDSTKHNTAAWIKPCSCNTLSHRQCIEKQMILAGMDEVRRRHRHCRHRCPAPRAVSPTERLSEQAYACSLCAPTAARPTSSANACR
jgi:hypothetical protein